ncbi:alanine racemase [Agrobacterium sp. T29]|uniref:alanine racemase n=1 Tax=Agrobacterium sp. T29 TaxID=2580515 RepID=UPI00115E3802|nr:alanine racemase [Agrobacterium sp. T29]
MTIKESTANAWYSSLSGAALRGSWYQIDLGAIRHNYRQIRRHLSLETKIYACLKRNAYGCGAGPVAAALAEENVDGFAVASIIDAISIRNGGITSPILLYPGALPVAASAIETLGLIPTISSLDELRQWRSAIRTLRIFLKVDLGFFRAGATPLQIIDILAEAAADPNVTVEGIYAHMSELPNSAESEAYNQFEIMKRTLTDALSIGVPLPIVMMSSTDSVLQYPEMDFDAVDPGALFIGLSDRGPPKRNVILRPALTEIAASLVSVKRLDASLGPLPAIPGLHAGMTLGVIGMGWGDGLPRNIPSGATALVRGKRARLLPPAHLEHIRIDLTDVPDAAFGDRVILLGKQGEEHIDHDEAAHFWGTDTMGLYAHLRDHIPRVYIQS